MRKAVRAHRDHLRACSGETAMPEVWEQEGHLRARPCFRGDIEEELKRVDVDSQHTEAPWTTTGATAEAIATPTIKKR
jgi:hypothetical protein